MIIYLHDKRQHAMEWVPKVQHLLGGLPLLFSGMSKLGDPAERPVAIAEILVAAIVLAAFVKELAAELRHHGHAHSRVGWFDLAAGALLIFEAFHGAHHKPGYLRPQFLSGVVTIALGLFHARLDQHKKLRRYLKLDESGIEFRLARFRHFTIPWQNLSSMDLDGGVATFYLKDGARHRVRLNLLHDADTIRQSIREHASAAGVRIA